MLYIKVRGGLCNRLRVIASAVNLSRQSGHGIEICIVWCRHDSDTYARYCDLFEQTKEFTVVDADDKRLDEILPRFSTRNSQYIGQDKMGPWEARELAVSRIKCAPQDDWYLETYNQFTRHIDYQWMKPVSEIATEAGKWASKFGAECFGMHIRRTDNFMSMVYSPVELFEKVVQDALTRNKFARFYLASDDEEVKKRFVERFGAAIITRHGLSARFQAGGAAQALVDILLLAQTKTVYGCYWSSFSSQAAQVGGVPFVCLKDENQDGIIFRGMGAYKGLYDQMAGLKAMLVKCHENFKQFDRELADHGLLNTQADASVVQITDSTAGQVPLLKVVGPHTWDKWRFLEDWQLCPDLICSLGGDCVAASQIKVRGLRPFSLPFDWCMTDGAMAIWKLAHMFKVGFSDFARRENLNSIPDSHFGYKDTLNGFSFIHHFNAPIENPGEFDRFNAVLQRRLHRLLHAIQMSKSVLFLISKTWKIDSSCLNCVIKTCSECWPDKEFRAILVTYNSQPAEVWHTDSIGVIRLPRDRTSYDLKEKVFEWSFLDAIHYSEDAKRMHDMLARGDGV